MRGADVVEEAGEEVGFVGDGESVRGAEVGLDRSAWMSGVAVSVGDEGEGRAGCTVVVDAHAVVECFFPELFFGVVEDCVREGRTGEGDARDRLGFWGVEAIHVAKEGGDGSRLGGPAVGLEG